MTRTDTMLEYIFERLMKLGIIALQAKKFGYQEELDRINEEIELLSKESACKIDVMKYIDKHPDMIVDVDKERFPNAPVRISLSDLDPRK